MNSIVELQATATEIALDEQFLRDLADVEMVLVGGGEIVIAGN